MVRTAGLHPLLGEHSASPQPVTRKQWELATWLSGDYHDRTFTGKLTAPSRRTSLLLAVFPPHKSINGFMDPLLALNIYLFQFLNIK